jgi:hypothetical protein
LCLLISVACLSDVSSNVSNNNSKHAYAGQIE